MVVLKMIFYFIFLILAIGVNDVRSDCDDTDDYLKCLGEFVRDFFVRNPFNATDVESEDKNTTDDSANNAINNNLTINNFDITDLETGLEKVLEDVTSLLKEELEEELRIKAESEVFKSVYNNTEIHVKTLDFDKILNRKNISNNDDGVVVPFNFSEVPESNLTLETINENYQDIKYNTPVIPNMSIYNITSQKTVQIPGSNITESAFEINFETLKGIDNETEFYIQPYYFEEKSSDVQTTESDKNVILNVTQVTIENVTVVEIPTANGVVAAKLSTEGIGSDYNFSNGTDIWAINDNDTTMKHTDFIIFSYTTTEANSAPNTKTTTFKNFNLAENIKTNEISKTDDSDVYYDNEDNATDYPILDYIEFYKDTTNEAVDYKPTEVPTNSEISDLDNAIDSVIKEDLSNDDNEYDYTNPNCSGASIATAISWIATIFVKNDSNNQFEYYCDGVLLSNSIVLTAARCVNITKSPITNAENYIVILGKRSLQTARGDERVYRVKQIILHENFTVRESGMVNDLAMLVLDEPVVFGRTIRAACVGFETPVESFTTGWGFSGNLTAILFDEGRRTDCKRNTLSEKTFCGIYGKDVSVCPSYGGMYVTRQADNRWALQGLRTADTSNRGFCIDKSVTFTALSGYSDWINEKLENYRY